MTSGSNKVSLAWLNFSLSTSYTWSTSGLQTSILLTSCAHSLISNKSSRFVSLASTRRREDFFVRNFSLAQLHLLTQHAAITTASSFRTSFLLLSVKKISRLKQQSSSFWIAITLKIRGSLTSANLPRGSWKRKANLSAVTDLAASNSEVAYNQWTDSAIALISRSLAVTRRA